MLANKKFRDAEARVVKVIGSYQYECEMYVATPPCTSQHSAPHRSCTHYYRPNGVRFLAVPGTKEFVRRYNNVDVGDVVTFKHRGFLLGSKKPKVATLYRLRRDLSWDDLVKNWKEQKPTFTGT